CASWFVNYRKSMSGNSIHKIFYIQIWFAAILVISIIGLSILIFGHNSIIAIGISGLLILIIFIMFMHQNDLTKSIMYPAFAICLVFVFMLLIYGRICSKYDTGYQAARYISIQKESLPVVDYNVNSLTLEFYTKNKYIRAGDDSKLQLQQMPKPYYVLLKSDDLAKLQKIILPEKLSILTKLNGAAIDVVMANLLSKTRLKQKLTYYLVVKVE
ncbi:MAG: glycosyl transferase, partial [Burkholderiales bacterium]|nr:glycosyl transferase [Burkholderiales bacterium]